MAQAEQQSATRGQADDGHRVDAIIDQMAKIADHYMGKQTELAKRLLGHCDHTSPEGSKAKAEDIWTAWVDGCGDMYQQWFSCIQLVDALCDHKPAKHKTTKTHHHGTASNPGVFTKEVEITNDQPVAMTIQPTDFTDIDNHVISATNVSLSPNTIAAGSTTTVTVTLRPPATTPTNMYGGSITDAAGKVVVSAVELYVKGT
jgi:hypothetical protein